MTYKDTKQTQERYAIKKSSKWKTAGSVLVASLIFGSSVVLNENKASADETNTESTLSTVATGETTADLIEESVQTEDASNTTETSSQSYLPRNWMFRSPLTLLSPWFPNRYGFVESPRHYRPAKLPAFPLHREAVFHHHVL